MEGAWGGGGGQCKVVTSVRVHTQQIKTHNSGKYPIPLSMDISFSLLRIKKKVPSMGSGWQGKYPVRGGGGGGKCQVSDLNGGL